MRSVKDIGIEIKQSIHHRLTLEFDYENKTRIANPHYFGRTTADNDAISCWQIAGKSRSGKLGCKTFSISKIRNLKVTERHFELELSMESPPKNFLKIYASAFKGENFGND